MSGQNTQEQKVNIGDFIMLYKDNLNHKYVSVIMSTI